MKKRQFFFVLISSSLLLGSYPVHAETNLKDKINEQNQIIDALKNKKVASNQAITELEEKIEKLQAQVEESKAKKVKLESEVSQLSDEIRSLTAKIQKREEKIKEQARTVQVNGKKTSLLTVIINADSFTDAIGKSIAYQKLIRANHEIVETQKTEKEAVNKKKAAAAKKLAQITKTSAKLQKESQNLAQTKLKQVALANELAAKITTEEGKKKTYLEQQKAAEKKQKELAAKQAEAARLAQQQKEQEQQVIAAISPEETTSAADQTTAQTPSQTPTPPKQGGSDFKWPLPNLTISSGYGGREDPTGNAGNMHHGIDFVASYGMSVMASRDGVVEASGYEPGGGNHVIIKHDNGYYTYYLHLSQRLVSAGEQVKQGQVVGLVGSTGDSTGPHLHFGISTGFWANYLDPGPFLGLY